MPPALLPLLASVVYGSSYATSRAAMADVPPATLALLRLVLGALVLIPLAARARWGARLTGADRVKVFWMGALGFAGAYGLSSWGIMLSTATNAALLAIVEPLTLIVLGAVLLGERFTPRGAVGAVLALAGAVCVVLDGVPGVSPTLRPHWRGDLLLVLSGVAFAYSSWPGWG